MQEIEKAEYYEQMNAVVELYITGDTNPTAISRELGMKRVDVVKFIDEWKRTAANRPDLQDRAMESLTAMDRHYDKIIKEMWGIVNGSPDDKVRAGVLKNIADVESKRQETLQKAGLFDDSGMADQMAETEAKVEAIKKLLAEVGSKYPQSKLFIMEGLKEIFGQSPSIPDVVDGEIL